MVRQKMAYSDILYLMVYYWCGLSIIKSKTNEELIILPIIPSNEYKRYKICQKSNRSLCEI
jgi:hypothetical protein